MPRMLGRFETPGCCPGTRSGFYRRRHVSVQDCPGGQTSTRRRKRAEAREWRAELRPEGTLYASWDDPTACAHACNGECLTDGSEWCSFACHLDGPVSEAEYWAARAVVLAEVRR